MKYCFATFVLFLLLSLGIKAQELANFSYVNDTSKFAFVLSTGSTGLGVHYALKVHPQFNLKAGFSLLSLKGINWPPVANRHAVNAETKFTSLQLNAHLEYYPSRQKSFKWIVGINHFDDLSITGLYNYNPFEQRFQSGVKVSNNGVAPFVGLGWGDIIPKKKMGLSINLGISYLGKPKVEIIDSNQLLFNSSQQANKFEQQMNRILFLPNIAIGLSFKP